MMTLMSWQDDSEILGSEYCALTEGHRPWISRKELIWQGSKRKLSPSSSWPKLWVIDDLRNRAYPYKVNPHQPQLVRLQYPSTVCLYGDHFIRKATSRYSQSDMPKSGDFARLFVGVMPEDITHHTQPSSTRVLLPMHQELQVIRVGFYIIRFDARISKE
jgi:hypothetical protein